MLEIMFTFDDVLLVPKFSKIRSRAEIDLSRKLILDGKVLDQWKLPVISANMDTVTEYPMAQAMHSYGALACLHRFWSIEDNVVAFKKTGAWVSVGLGAMEFERAAALWDAGARIIVLDVAHAAQVAVVEQYVRLKKQLQGTFVIVGNFATAGSANEFYDYMNLDDSGPKANIAIDGIKVGIGPGSACTTRIKTGVGMPQLSAVHGARMYEDRRHGPYGGLVIADGGCRTPGDVAKALAAGADLVMLGGMLAGTDETPGEVVESNTSYKGQDPFVYTKHKKYRGSASKESYTAQGKDQAYITAEGESFTVPYKGPVSTVLQDIEGGLRSAFSYVGAKNLSEFHEKVEFVRISANGVRENGAHGKKS